MVFYWREQSDVRLLTCHKAYLNFQSFKTGCLTRCKQEGFVSLPETEWRTICLPRHYVNHYTIGQTYTRISAYFNRNPAIVTDFRLTAIKEAQTGPFNGPAGAPGPHVWHPCPERTKPLRPQISSLTLSTIVCRLHRGLQHPQPQSLFFLLYQTNISHAVYHPAISPSSSGAHPAPSVHTRWRWQHWSLILNTDFICCDSK